ncbi:MAG: DUF4249 domain-containing protein [Chlorobi bacterium]|nr:DUF4249 domain-containing protein [Chlorobiota bacterium]
MKKLITATILFSVLTSCEKVINFELENAEPQIVIEATTNGTTQTTKVLLSYSGGYYNSDGFEKITGAEIFLTVDSESKQMLTEINPGVYEGFGQIIRPGQSCHLEVSTSGRHYSAFSQMPEIVMIDSAYYQYSPETLFAPEGYRAIVTFTDPPETGNYYRVMLEVDGQMVTDGIYYLFSDKSGTQGIVNYVLYRNTLVPNSRFRVKLFSIDKSTYDYYSELDKLSGSDPGPAQAAPANPENNIQPEALGYFSARAESISETIFIQSK